MQKNDHEPAGNLRPSMRPTVRAWLQPLGRWHQPASAALRVPRELAHSLHASPGSSSGVFELLHASRSSHFDVRSRRLVRFAPSPKAPFAFSNDPPGLVPLAPWSAVPNRTQDGVASKGKGSRVQTRLMSWGRGFAPWTHVPFPVGIVSSPQGKRGGSMQPTNWWRCPPLRAKGLRHWRFPCGFSDTGREGMGVETWRGGRWRKITWVTSSSWWEVLRANRASSHLRLRPNGTSTSAHTYASSLATISSNTAQALRKPRTSRPPFESTGTQHDQRVSFPSQTSMTRTDFPFRPESNRVSKEIPTPRAGPRSINVRKHSVR